MSDVPVIQVFPRRSIQIVKDPSHARRRKLMLIGALLLFLPLIYYGYSTLERWSLREDLRARGVAAEVLTAEGSCLARRGLTEDEPRGCNLDITYSVRPEHGGGIREASVYLPGAAPLALIPPARYDPENPDRIMLDREIEQDERIVDLAIPLAIFIAMPVLALLVWFGTGRKALAAAAADPKPAIVPIEKAVRVAPSNRLDITFRRPDGGIGMRSFAKGGPLLVAPPPGAPGEQQWALALLTDRGWPILLDQDLAELDLTDGERDAIHRAARGNA